MDNICISRHPVFNRDGDIEFYYLSYRGCEKIVLAEGENPACNLLATVFFNLGFDNISSSRKVAVSFDNCFLEKDCIPLLSKEDMYIMISSNLLYCDEIKKYVAKLYDSGYRIIIDIKKEDFDEDCMLRKASIVRVSFNNRGKKHIDSLLKRCRLKRIPVIACDIMEPVEYKEAFDAGFDFFQGSYFKKPEEYKTDVLRPQELQYLNLIEQISRPEPVFSEVAKYIKSDVVFSFEILNLANTSLNSFERIKSIDHALAYLGLKGLKRWIYLNLIRRLAGDKHKELSDVSLLRAKFLEMLSTKIGDGKRKESYYTLGILSFIDVFTKRRMEDVLEWINLDDELKDILCGKGEKTFMRNGFEAMVAYEEGRWGDFEKLCGEMKITCAELGTVYVEAIRWFNEFREELEEIKSGF